MRSSSIESSSIEVVFHLGRLPLRSSSTRVDLQMFKSQLAHFQLFTYYSGWAGRWLEKSRLRLTQPSLAVTGAELGNYELISPSLSSLYLFRACLRLRLRHDRIM